MCIRDRRSLSRRSRCSFATPSWRGSSSKPGLEAAHAARAGSADLLAAGLCFGASDAADEGSGPSDESAPFPGDKSSKAKLARIETGVVLRQFAIQLSAARLGTISSCARPGPIEEQRLRDSLRLRPNLHAGKPEVEVLEVMLLGVVAPCRGPHTTAIERAVPQLIAEALIKLIPDTGGDGDRRRPRQLVVRVGDRDRTVGLQKSHRPLEHQRLEYVVRVERKDVASGRYRDPGVASDRDSPVRLAQQSDAMVWISLHKLLCGLGRVVGAAVIDDDNLPVGPCLGNDARDGLPEELGLPVARNDHRDRRW